MIRAFVIAIGALLVGGALYATIAIPNGGWIIGLQAGAFGVAAVNDNDSNTDLRRHCTSRRCKKKRDGPNGQR